MRSAWFVLLAACSGTEEAAVVELPVTTSAAPLATATNDLGYSVQLTRMRVAVTTVEFTVEGETHADVGELPPGTIAHPGHSAGGEVTGELPGDHVLEWTGSTLPPLGNGSLIVGDYTGANFAFRAATATDVAAGDPLLGHTFHLTGTVTKDATTRAFDAVLDVEPDAEVIGAPFVAQITEASTTPLAFVFHPTDPNEQDTAFDGIDFFTLSATGPIEIRPGSAAHNILRRAIQTHDHYGVLTP